MVCIFGLCGACRTDEFSGICLKDVKEYPDMYHVQVHTTKTKVARSFTITGEFFDIVKKYRDLRPAKILTSRFFIIYRNRKCTSQVIGKNTFSKMPRIIAAYLELPDPDRYTGMRVTKFGKK